MRILNRRRFVDPATSVQDISAARRRALRRKTPSVENVILAFSGRPAAAAAPAKSAGGATDDGCPQPEPLQPCPPCSLHDQPELLATILDAIGMALLNRGCLEAGSRFVARRWRSG